MGIEHFANTLDQVGPLLHAITNWNEPMGPDKWTKLELLGHLLDSAANNHQRFVRALSQAELVWPGYDQDAHVKVQRFAHADPQKLVPLVLNFNHHLAGIFGHFPADKLHTKCRIGEDSETTLEQLAKDYVAHCEHHLKQLVGAEAATWSGLPWPPAVL